MTFNFWSLSWHTVKWMLQFLKPADAKHGVLWQFSLLGEQRQNAEWEQWIRLTGKRIHLIVLHWMSFLSLSWKKFVADCVTRNIKSLLTKPQEFLQLPAYQLAETHDYPTSTVVAHTVAGVNDHAERVIVLIHQFSGSLTRNEEQSQFLLQVVAGNRKRYP